MHQNSVITFGDDARF